MNFFSESELACRHCGEYQFDPHFLNLLNQIRAACDFPLIVSSGYRCLEHPEELVKTRPGAHTRGLAVDLAVGYDQAFWVVYHAMAHGIERIGVSQQGASRFVHLDIDKTLPSPRIWSY